MAKPADQPPESLPAAVRLHQLEGFHYVATHEGFTRAARAMPYPITEPALHQQVRKLERTLGVKLLEQGAKRRMVLTPAGRALHRFVAPYFQELPAILRGVQAGEEATLVVATEPLYVEGLCAEALARLGETHSKARLVLLELGTPAEIAARIAQGKVDVGIAGGVSAAPAGCAYQELGTLRLELRVPGAHPLADKRPPLRPSHLENLRCVVYEQGSEGRAWTQRALDEAGVEVVALAEAGSASAMLALVRAGLGPAFLPALGAPRARRSKNRDGTVSFDLTNLVAKMAGLPGFGVLLRTGKPPPLVKAFCAAARDLVG